MWSLTLLQICFLTVKTSYIQYRKKQCSLNVQNINGWLKTNDRDIHRAT